MERLSRSDTIGLRLDWGVCPRGEPTPLECERERGGIWCDLNVPLSFIILSIGEKIYDSHVLVANTGDEGTANRCGPCARALWPNVGSIGIASSSGSVGLQMGQTEIYIPATRIFALLPRGYTQGLYSRSAQSTAAGGETSSHRYLDRQPKSCLLGRLAGWQSGSAGKTPLTGTVWLANPRCIL